MSKAARLRPQAYTCQMRSASTGFRELFRYRKSGRTRTYSLRFVEDGVELWVVSAEGQRVRKLTTFADPDDVAPFAEDVERELRAGGWSLG